MLMDRKELVKDKLLVLKEKENDFEDLIECLKNEFIIETCEVEFPKMKIMADDIGASLVICKLSAIRRNDLMKAVSNIPNLFVYYQNKEYTAMMELIERGLKYYELDIDNKSIGAEKYNYIRMLCYKSPFRYHEFKSKISEIVYEKLNLFRGRNRTGYSYTAESVLFLLFCDKKCINMLDDVYTYISKKFNVNYSNIDPSVKRFIESFWENRQLAENDELLCKLSFKGKKPTTSEFIYEFSDLLFFRYRSEFYRYFMEINN